MCKEMCRDLCQTLSKLVGYILLFFTAVMMIFGLAGTIISASYLFGDLDFNISILSLPDYMFYAVFAFSLVILLLNMCGCLGITMAMRKADQKLNGIMEDGDNESAGCRCCMKVWIAAMLVFGLIHICMGVTSLSSAGNLDMSEYNVDASGMATSSVSDVSCKVESAIDENYGPDFNSTDWVEFQRYFSCCGYSLYDTRTWTGACCPDPADYPEAEDAVATNSTDNVVTSSCDIEGVTAYPTTDPPDFSQCDNEMTCSARMSQLFGQLGLFFLILGLFEWTFVALAFCLSCCSKTAKDDRPQP